jgi:hypothetical protein
MAADVCAEGAACALLAFAHRWKDIMPLVGAVIIATTAATVAFLATWRLNKVMKQTEVFLKFTERYHNIMLAKHQLELRNDEKNADQTSKPGDEQVKKEAYELYRQYFGLMFDEFFSYQRGFLACDLFVEWMMWRHHEYRAQEGTPNFAIAGLAYKDGWEQQRADYPTFRSEFAAFLGKVHKTDARPEHLKSTIRKIVTSYGSRSQRIRARLTHLVLEHWIPWLAHLVVEYWILWMMMALAIGVVLIWSIFK